MTKRIAVYRSSFNPPGRRHQRIAEMLSREFDEVVIAPWHRLPGQEVRYDVESVYRATMVDLAFRKLANVRVEFFDIEARNCTPASNIRDKVDLDGDVWFVISPEMIEGGGAGKSLLHQVCKGDALWKEGQYLILRRPDEPLDENDLPPKHRFVEFDVDGTSKEIRSRIFHHEPVGHWVDPTVESYIQRHCLYRGTPHTRTTNFLVDEVRPLIVVDEWNDEAYEVTKKLPSENADDPNFILVVGGDGTMLRAIRQDWRRRLPFYGINTGHLGFLLNSNSPVELVGQSLVLEQLSLLRVETLSIDGERKVSLAFNEAWVERGTGQTAWIEVKVNGKVRLSKLVADGALVATAGGSTSYARAMGATPLPLSTPALLLVGSNVLLPVSFRPVLLTLDSTIELRTLDPAKRPLNGFVDGVPHGRIQRMTVETSSVAAVELAFDSHHDPAEKLARIQFPMIEDG